MPLVPLVPFVPLTPPGPVGPDGPVAPFTPVGPDGPVTPVGPLGPVAPVAPVGPVGPAAPVGPVGPVGPGIGAWMSTGVQTVWLSRVLHTLAGPAVAPEGSSVNALPRCMTSASGLIVPRVVENVVFPSGTMGPSNSSPSLFERRSAVIFDFSPFRSSNCFFELTDRISHGSKSTTGSGPLKNAG